MVNGVCGDRSLFRSKPLFLTESVAVCDGGRCVEAEGAGADAGAAPCTGGIPKPADMLLVSCCVCCGFKPKPVVLSPPGPDGGGGEGAVVGGGTVGGGVVGGGGGGDVALV